MNSRSRFAVAFAFVALFAGCNTASKPKGSTPTFVTTETERLYAAPALKDQIDEPFLFARLVAIGALRGVEKPAGTTTAALGPRKSSTVERFPDQVEIETKCGENWCVDGLTIRGSKVIAASLSKEEREVYGAGNGSTLERAIRISHHDKNSLSIYIATSEFSGGAHANNTYECRSFDLKTGKQLKLHDLFEPKLADRLLEKTAALLRDPELAIQTGVQNFDVLLNSASFTLNPFGFRLDHSKDYRGSEPEIVLCAEGPYPSGSSTLLELKVEALPVGYLLR